MKPVLLIDFGSTYTKVTAVDVENEALLGTASSYTTVQTDIGEGLENALHILEQKTGTLEFAERYACSSAAGGLRMITSGLVPELTAEAAKQASLGGRYRWRKPGMYPDQCEKAFTGRANLSGRHCRQPKLRRRVRGAFGWLGNACLRKCYAEV